MWFLFGFVTLTGFTLFFLYRKFYSAWTGTHAIVGESSYEYKYKKNKHGITGLLIGVKGINDYDFSFRRENWFDRLCKALEISEELQFHDSELDRMVYVISDNEYLHRGLKFSSEFKEALKKLFEYGNAEFVKLKKVECNSGRLWLEFSAGKGFYEAALNEVAKTVLPSLTLIRDRVNQISPRDKSRWRDPFFYKAALLLSISSALAINGGLHLFRINLGNFPLTIDTQILWHQALAWGIGIIFVLVLVTFFLLGRSARTHLVLLEILTIGFAGAVATAYAELRDQNIEQDVSTPDLIETYIERKYMTSGKRNSHTYYLVVYDWFDKQSDVPVKVSASMYNQFSNNQPVAIIYYKGARGYRWVFDIRPRE